MKKNKTWVQTQEETFKLQMKREYLAHFGELTHRRHAAFLTLDEMHWEGTISAKEYNTIAKMIESDDPGNITVAEELLKVKSNEKKKI